MMALFSCISLSFWVGCRKVEGVVLLVYSTRTDMKEWHKDRRVERIRRSSIGWLCYTDNLAFPLIFRGLYVLYYGGLRVKANKIQR